MEYDNDKIIKRAYKKEIYYWLLLACMNPMVNGITIFEHDTVMWVALFIVNLILLPAYLFFSVGIVPKLFFRKKYNYFFLAAIVFLALVLLLVFALYSLVLDFPVPDAYHDYFSFNTISFIREIIWLIMNTSLAFAISFIRKADDDKDVLLQLEKDNTSFRLKYLRAQLNPHFLFNTLNSIYSLSLQKSDKAPGVVVKLADLMRYLIYDCEQEKILLEKEIEFIQNYIDIEKIRFNADIRFTVEGDTKNIFIEPFLFISFIENGFKHALDNALTEPFIYITIKVEKEQIVLNVINTSNIDLETQAKKINGRGLTNSKSLLELLYPSSYELDIIQTEKEERINNTIRLKNARERLQELYPDQHTLDVILNKSSFTVSLILKSHFA